MHDLFERLQFAPDEGRISLGGQRMLLLHASALQTLRQALIESLGVPGARALLTRVGYQAGAQDAQLARRVRGAASALDAFLAGPQLHGIEGIVRVELVRMDIDVERGHHRGEFLWHDSVEDEDFVARYGLGDSPACWTQIGYASGYTSGFMGRTIVYREVACRAMGDALCRIVGMPAEDWDDAAEDLHYLGLAASAAAPPAGPGRHRRGAKPAVLPAAQALVGRAPAFVEALRQLREVAPSDAPVLLLGETGAGKERFARELHRLGRRADGPFVAVNCAALPDTLLEAEMFGVEKGAYTGAGTPRAGRFERADGGTLFLDEVASLSAAGQAKLLRVLQDCEVERLGGTRARRVDVRVVAAASPDLLQQVADGRFRRDLFYRLAVVPIRIPALRDRPQDVPLLARHCLANVEARHARRSGGFAHGVLDALAGWAFPGNVRELENLIERAVLITPPGRPITLAALEPVLGEAHDTALMPRSLPQLEAHLLERAVTAAGGNLSRAARQLGITRAQLAYRLGKYGLARPRPTMPVT
ncbi:MAG: sigma 54-interacting transcriptional regulator [Pseudomonadota bacterium]